MSDFDPKYIANWIIGDFIDDKQKSLKEIIAQIVNSRIPAFSVERCAEIAEGSYKQVYRLLAIYEEESFEQGVEPIFEMQEDGEEIYFKSIKSKAKDLLEKLILLDSEDFEHFCACLLQEMGSNAKTEGRPGDQGVDFIARNVPIGHIRERSQASSINVFLVGQAKRYSTHILVREKEVREFIGGAIKRSMDFIREHAFEAGVLSPIIYAFWTTSNFHPNARKFCVDVGLWYLNGLALSQLALRVGINLKSLHSKIDSYKKRTITM